MRAKFLSWTLGGLAILATAVWAAVPDSMIQNQVFDRARALEAHGRLIAVSDQNPLGERYPILLVLGLNGSKDSDGPAEDELVKMAQPVISNWTMLYRLWTKRELLSDVKVYGFWYNSDSADPQIAKWLDARVETEPELTEKNVKLSAVCHSKGGNVLFCYWVQTDSRKLDAKVTSGTPHIGTMMADRDAVERAVLKAFPLLGKWLNKVMSSRGMNFNAAGVKWLLPNYPEMIALRKAHPLDSTWTLIGGRVQPSGGNVVSRNMNLGLLLDRIVLESGNSQDTKAYQVGALILEQGGVTGGSDGVVPLKSAGCEGYADDARIVHLSSDHNHSEMWWGNGGIELYAEMLKPIMPYITAKRQKLVPKQSQGFDIWLPQMPQLDFPVLDTSRLQTARIAWISDGHITVAGESANNPTELQLGGGEFEWPQWLGDDLVATWHHGGESDVVLLRASDGKLMNLTNNGTSGLAGTEDTGAMVTFVSDGNLMLLRSADELAKVLVWGSVRIDTPPVILGEKVYFAQATASGYDLRWVSTDAASVSIAYTILVEAGVSHPMKLGVALLALKSADETTQLVTISQWWSGALDQNIKSVLQTLRQDGVPNIDLVDFDSRSGATYLVVEGDQICQLDMGLVLQSFTQSVEVTWDTLAPKLADGMQLDVK